MKQRFTLLSCLLIAVSLQVNLFAYGYCSCGCGKKKNYHQVQCIQEILFNGGCGCGGGGGNSGSEDIPPDTEA